MAAATSSLPPNPHSLTHSHSLSLTRTLCLASLFPLSLSLVITARTWPPRFAYRSRPTSAAPFSCSLSFFLSLSLFLRIPDLRACCKISTSLASAFLADSAPLRHTTTTGAGCRDWDRWCRAGRAPRGANLADRASRLAVPRRRRQSRSRVFIYSRLCAPAARSRFRLQRKKLVRVSAVRCDRDGCCATFPSIAISTASRLGCARRSFSLCENMSYAQRRRLEVCKGKKKMSKSKETNQRSIRQFPVVVAN